MSFRIALLAAVAMVSSLQAEKPAAAAAGDEVARVAAIIDQHISKVWQAAEITPAPTSGDAEFCRRVYLGIAGRIPHVSEIREFLADKRANKRRLLVDRLLDSNGYVNNFTRVWRKVMIPEVATDVRARFLSVSFEDWLRRQLLDEKTRFDKIVKALIVTPVGPRPGRRPRLPTPVAFYESKENKPENIAAATSRMFLGIRLECAQCHEHPFDNWSQKQFWGYAAFFARVRRNRANNVFTLIRDSFDRRQITIPDTEVVVSATLLDGTAPTRKQGQTARQALADWLTSADNPYFAKATVNRIWGHLFGKGIVAPVDDMSASNAPTHPKLLSMLAQELKDHDFDLKFLIRAITASQAYQRSSRQTHASQQDGELFSRMVPLPLTDDQLLASLAVALGRPDLANQANTVNATPNQISEVFSDGAESASERTATILQSLAMMNGQIISNATTTGRGATLTAVAEAPWMKTEDRITTLYLASLSRPPRDGELSKLVKFVNRNSTKKDRDGALGDVFWMLLNSSEFLLNN